MQSATAVQEVEEVPMDRHAAFRQKLLDETPGWYNPYVHLAVPSTFGIAFILAMLSRLAGLTLIEALTVPLTYVFANAVEWWAHKYLLHHRSPLAPVLYDQHTPKHHVVYTHRDMAIRDLREFRLVLIPAYGIMLIGVAILPVVYALSRFTTPNIGALYGATAMFYSVSYEWLHLSYHMDPDSFVGRLGLVRWLRVQHTIHHNPRLMTSKNFNVTVPVWDHVMGTATTDGDRE
jgi:sterol desaturase/sphingolipid hydroxylase (fatty acid hydroxylase superfamily)